MATLATTTKTRMHTHFPVATQGGKLVATLPLLIIIVIPVSKYLFHRLSSGVPSCPVLIERGCIKARIRRNIILPIDRPTNMNLKLVPGGHQIWKAPPAPLAMVLFLLSCLYCRWAKSFEFLDQVILLNCTIPISPLVKAGVVSHQSARRNENRADPR